MPISDQKPFTVEPATQQQMASLWTWHLRQLHRSPQEIHVGSNPWIPSYHDITSSARYRYSIRKYAIIDHCTLMYIVHVQKSGVNMCQPI